MIDRQTIEPTEEHEMSQENIDRAIGEVQVMTDEELNRFVDFIREEMGDRKRLRNRQAMAQIALGSRVRFAGKMKPQYLMGQTGEVVEIKQSRVTVKLDQGPQGKFRSGKVVAPASALVVLGGE